LPASSCAPRRKFPTIASSDWLLTGVDGERKKKAILAVRLGEPLCSSAPDQPFAIRIELVADLGK
jgi:hypothetical protein